MAVCGRFWPVSPPNYVRFGPIMSGENLLFYVNLCGFMWINYPSTCLFSGGFWLFLAGVPFMSPWVPISPLIVGEVVVQFNPLCTDLFERVGNCWLGVHHIQTSENLGRTFGLHLGESGWIWGGDTSKKRTLWDAFGRGLCDGRWWGDLCSFWLVLVRLFFGES